MNDGPPPTGSMLEREGDLRALSALIADGKDGRARVALIEGPAGIGKTSLVAAARAQAVAAGVTVLAARGGELEGDFGFGVVRQLLEPELARADTDRRAGLFSGAAQLAMPVFAPEPTADLGQPTYSVLHGLYWLTANLAERAPLLVAVDDVQWADAASLRFLLHLAGRLEGLPVALCLSARTGERSMHAELLAALLLQARPPVIRPRALSAAAVERLVRAGVRAEASPELCSALHEATRGNPFLLVEAVEQLRSGPEPVGAIDPAAIRRLAPDRIATSLLLRVGRIDRRAPALARSVAVLGEGATVDRAARLADVDAELAPRLVDALARAAILAPGEPLAFVHPIVRTTIYEAMGATRRAELHLRAARMLLAEGAGEETVAVHLLASDPAADAAAVEVLRTAAATATGRGSPETAVQYLRRALREPPSDPDVTEVLVKLGLAEITAGDPNGIEHLREALTRSPSGRPRAEVARVLARALVAAGRQAEAVAVYDSGIAEADDDLALELEAEAATAARQARSRRAPLGERLARSGRSADGVSPAARMVLAEQACDRAFDGGPATVASAMARRALDGGFLVAHTANAGPVWDAVYVLMAADELDLAEHHLEGLLSHGRARGSLVSVTGASAFRAYSALRRGDVAKAASEAEAAIAAAKGALGLGLALGTAYLAHSQIERGELEAAATRLQGALPGAAVPDNLVVDHLLFARARLRLAAGEPIRAVADLRLIGDHAAGAVRGDAPLPHIPGIEHRALLAIALRRLGEEQEARRAGEEELAMARAWDTPRAIGIALCAKGLIEGGEPGIATLKEAVELLAASPGRLDHARALVDLGLLLRRAGKQADARHWLSEGMDMAHGCGASALAETAREELRLAGARPRRLARTGVHSLTPAEYRVCEMACDGMTNKEIAQALFVTLRTIEGHLSNSYIKLEITSRAQLPKVLAPSATAAASRLAAASPTT